MRQRTWKWLPLLFSGLILFGATGADCDDIIDELDDITDDLNDDEDDFFDGLEDLFD